MNARSGLLPDLRSAGYEPAGMILTPTGVWLPHLASMGSDGLALICFGGLFILAI